MNEFPQDDAALAALLQRAALDDLPDDGFSDALMRALPRAATASRPDAGRVHRAVQRWTLPFALGVASAGFVAWSPALLGAVQGRQPMEQALPGLVLFALVAAWSWWSAAADAG